MPTLLEQLQAVTSGSGVSTEIGAQAGQLGQIVQLVQQLASSPPGDFQSYLTQLQQISLPQVSVGGNLGQAFGDILPNLQGELGGVLQQLVSSADTIQSRAGGGLGAALGPLLEAINQLRDLLTSDWSCGLIPEIVPPPPAPPGPPPPPGSPPAPSPSDPILAPVQVDAARAAIDTLPSDLGVESLLKWLHERIGTADAFQDFFPLRSLPVIDDLRDPLDTIVRWDGLTGFQLAEELRDTLATLATIVEASTTAVVTAPFVPATVAAIPASAVAAAGTALGTALDDLLAAVQAQDAGAIGASQAAAQAAVAQITAANATLVSQQAALLAIEDALRALPSELETNICRLLVLSQPRSTWADITGRLGGPPTVLSNDTFAPLTELFGRVSEFLNNILDRLDISAVTAPITNALGEVTHAIQGVEQNLALLTASARAQFQQAHDALAAFDLGAVQQQAENALGGATSQVQQALAQGLAPATEAIGTAVTAVNDALGGFDPEQIGEPVRNAIDAIAQVFEDPSVQQLLDALKQLRALAERLDELTFRPVSDLVIDGIGGVKSALQAIDQASLPPPGPELISEAMSVLPPSLTPLTDPLISGLDELLDNTPRAALERLKELPASVAEELRAFSPRALLSEPLDEPFKAMRAGLEQFNPTEFLDQAESALDGLKQRLAQSLDLEPLLAPVVEAQQALIDQLSQFRPGAVLEPLTKKLEEAGQALDVALPTEPITQALDQVLSRARSFTGTLGQVIEIVNAFTDKLTLLGDPAAQLDVWLTEILAKLPANAPAILDASLTDLREAVEASHAAPLRTAHQNARQSLDTALTTTNAEAILARAVQGRSRLTPALVNALPPSAAKTNLQQFLATFDPAGPAFAGGLRQLSRLRTALTAADLGVAETLREWDARYHRAGGALAGLVHTGVTVADLRQWVREALDRQLGAPVVGFLEQLKVLGALLRTFSTAITSMLAAIQTKLEQILAVPQALANAAQELTNLKQKILGVDLDLFTREIDSLYEQLVDQVRALDPRALAEALKAHLESLLDALSLGAIITPALRNEIDEAYRALKAVIETLDPELLIIQPLEETYQEQVLPLVDVLDISDVLQVLLDRLDSLPDELKEELQRVDTAYQDMLAAAPGSSPAGASVGVGV